MNKLYKELSNDWYRLLTPLEEYREEAEFFHKIFDRNLKPETMLELGCGSGHNAFYLKKWYDLTLVDMSENMLNLSRELNPECSHILGDMRTIQLDKKFDSIFIHDAIMYMNNEIDLKLALETAYVHLNHGGAALICPDFMKETFNSLTEHGGSDGPEKAVRYLLWQWDPDESDTQYTADYVYILRDANGKIKTEHERHILGLFGRDKWVELIKDAGFESKTFKDQFGREIFYCKKSE